ncbi:MAG: NAD(P)/FAD-dependent oxidoreductase [Dictyoglomaceae bacterium]
MDVIIIGGGIVGTLIARQLSKYSLKILLLERENDIAMGATKANSAIVHAGYDPIPNSNKAKTNVRGNKLYPELCSALKVPFKRNGALILAFNDEEAKVLEELKERGRKNGVMGLEIIKRDEILKREPNINPEVKMALYAPSSGITSPYLLAISALENAWENGIEVHLEEEVQGIIKRKRGYIVKTNKNSYLTRYIINAGGVYADEIMKMAGIDFPFEITPRKGEYYVLDKKMRNLVSSTIFPTPSPISKGVLVVPTVEGNILLGPNAKDVKDKEDKSTTWEGLKEVWEKATKLVPHISFSSVINTFAGIRAGSNYKDFLIKEFKSAEGILNFAGIDSPGLTSAPALAEIAEEWLKDKEKLIPKKNFKGEREKPLYFRELSNEEREELIKKDPSWGHIICRCEHVSEKELRETIRHPLTPKTLEALRKRLRIGTGRCHGAFCTPYVLKILSEELGKPINFFTLKGENSKILFGENKARWKYAKRS